MFKLNRFYYDNGAGTDGGSLPPAMGDVDDTTTLDSALGNSVEKITNLADVASPLPVKDVDAPEGDAGTADPGKDKGGDEGANKGQQDDDDKGDGSPTEDDLTPEVFFGEMEKLSGVKYEIEYPEGVNPLSPEGFVHRDKVVRSKALDDYEAYLKETDPRSYAYMLHRQAGKPDEEFFGEHKGFILPTAEQLTESVDVQRNVYKHSLVASGRDPEEADALVEVAIKNGKLKERSEAAFKRLDDANKADLAKIEQVAAQQAKQRQETETSTRAVIQQSIANMENFVVPETERPALEKFIWDKLRMTDDGKILIVQELDPKEAIKIVEGQLFQYMKGDLSGVVNKKAGTIASQRLSKKNIGALKTPSNNGANVNKTREYVPLTAVD